MTDIESLYDKVFDEVLSVLKFSSNGLPAVTDKDSKSRLELALELTEGVLSKMEEHKYPSMVVPEAKPAYRYFKAMDGRVWSCSTQINNVLRFQLNDLGDLVGIDETEIYGSIENLADCDDVKEIARIQFDNLIDVLKSPF